MLLEEEMRRSIEYCKWKANWWRSQVGARPTMAWNDQGLDEGLTAYANEQAAAEDARAALWKCTWSEVRARGVLVVSALCQTNSVSTPALDDAIEEDGVDSLVKAVSTLR